MVNDHKNPDIDHSTPLVPLTPLGAPPFSRAARSQVRNEQRSWEEGCFLCRAYFSGPPPIFVRWNLPA